MSNIKTHYLCASVFQIVSRQEKSGKKASVHTGVLVKISGRNRRIAGTGEKLKAGTGSTCPYLLIFCLILLAIPKKESDN
jgi:hypothetical protein